MLFAWAIWWQEDSQKLVSWGHFRSIQDAFYLAKSTKCWNKLAHFSNHSVQYWAWFDIECITFFMNLEVSMNIYMTYQKSMTTSANIMLVWFSTTNCCCSLAVSLVKGRTTTGASDPRSMLRTKKCGKPNDTPLRIIWIEGLFNVFTLFGKSLEIAFNQSWLIGLTTVSGPLGDPRSGETSSTRRCHPHPKKSEDGAPNRIHFVPFATLDEACPFGKSFKFEPNWNSHAEKRQT